MPRKEIKHRKIGQTIKKSFLVEESIKIWTKYPLREVMDAISEALKIGLDQLIEKRIEGRIHYWQESHLDDIMGLFPLSY